MKRLNIKTAVIAISFVAMSSSCNKKIELSPITSNVESSFYQTEIDCFQALTAAYGVLLWDAPQSNANVYAPGNPNASYQNAPFQLISEVLADHCFAGGSSATDVPAISRIDRGVIRVDDPTPAALWYKYYTGINRCNLLLEKMPAVAFSDSTLKARYAAECKFLRAYYYFDLVRLFGNVPLVLHTLAPSEYNQKQKSPEEVYTQIAKDLTEAIAILPRYKNILPTELGRATSDAARGLLMRTWLYYTGYYQKPEIPGVTSAMIITIADELIKNSGHDLLTNYSDVFQSLTPTASFVNNHKESVFEIQYSSLAFGGSFSYRELANGNLAAMLWSARVTSTAVYAAGWSFAPIDTAFYNQFDNTDKRKSVTFFLPKSASVAYTAGYQDLGVFPNKWIALTANNSSKGNSLLNYPNHFISIRFSDVLLMAAELHLLHGGNIGTAQQYFERVARRARPSSYVPPTVTLDVLYKERDLELALEGVRYWDLMRRSIDYAKNAININRGEPLISNFNYGAKGLFPIPGSELINTNNSLIQNTGY